MTEALDRPSKIQYLLVSFWRTFDGELVAAYTNRDSDFTFEGVEYESHTNMEVALPENSGLLNEAPCNFVLPRLEGFPTEIASGSPYPEVWVEVVEVLRSPGASSVYNRVFQGVVVGAQRNVRGRDKVGLSALSVKSRLRTATLGLQCMHQCVNTLGDARCGIALDTPPNRIFSAEVASIDGAVLTIVTGQIQTGLIDRFYQRGYIHKDGLPIMVKTWRNEVEGDRHQFTMIRRPPSFWVGSNVSIFVGCDKTIETCRAKFDNEQHFNGIGHFMPAYHPVFETGAGR